MRSFAKKLAFVMAAAMVVTTAAPAGQAAHAATKLDIALQGANSRAEAVESYNIEVGETVDFRFFGAADFAEFDPAWTSDLEDVATVNQGGKVTGQKDGVATITFGLSDGREGEVVVTVGNPTVYDVALGTAKDNTFTELTLEEGEEKDLNFYGVKDYKKANYDCTWTVEGDAVSIDKNGVVTAEKAGEAVVSLVVKNKTNGVSHNVASVVVTVPEKEVPVDNSYEYKQISHNEAIFVFSHEVAYTVEDVTLVKVFDGGYEVNMPIETFKCEGNVVTVKPYVSFADGDKYIIKIGAEDEGTEFMTTLGAVDYIEISYKSLDKAEKAFAKLNKEDEDIEVALSVKLFSNGVDVSGAPGYSLENVEFELVEESDDFDLDGNILVFETYGKCAQVKAVYTYDVNGEPVQKSNTTGIISEPAPTYTFVSVDKWTIAKRNDDDVKIDWTGDLNHSIPAFDENDSSIVLLMTDSYGNKIVYPSEFKDNSKYGDVTLLSFDDITENGSDAFIAAAEDFEIRYTSTNQNLIFVGTDNGNITTLGKSNAPVLISLYDENSEGDVVLKKNLFAADIKVTEERKPAKIIANVKVKELLTDIKNVVKDDRYEKGDVEFTVLDQYGVPVKGQSINISEANTKIVADGKTGTTNGDGVVTYTFDGKDFVYSNTKGDNVAVDAVKFTAKLDWPNDNVSTSFVVRTETPKVDKDGELKIEDWALAANNIDVKVEKSAETLKSNTITFYQTSNDLNVGIEDSATLISAGNKYLKDGKKEFSIPSNETSVGNMYVVVYNPDGEALTQTTTTSALGIYEQSKGVYSVTAATCSALAKAKDGSAEVNVMDYLKTGIYTVKAYRVAKVYTDDKNVNRAAKLEEFKTTFEVTNTSATVSLKEQKYIDLPANDISVTNVSEAIYEAFDFNLGDGTLNEDAAVIIDYDYKYNEESNYLFVYKVTFAVPYDNEDNSVCYRAYDVAVNKAVKVDSNFSVK